jgi:MarR family transcriptional regulator, organic hydroperoxide resistance regulator
MVATAVLTRKVPAAPGAEELVASVHDVMKLVLHRSQPALDAEGISMGQFWSLHVLSSLRSASLGTIARHLSISAPTACANLDLLEAAGLVTRRRSARDRRTVEHSLTAKGRRAETRIWGHVAKIMADAAKDLAPEDVSTAARVFQELGRRLEWSAARAEVAA